MGTLSAISTAPRRRDIGADPDSAPFITASIFPDILNVFLFFLQIFGRRRD